MAVLVPEGKQSFDGPGGVPLIGGKLYTYAAGTNTPQQTWKDAGQVATNTNPIILDARGEASIFWLGVYKIKLCDALDNEIWTVDGVVAAEIDQTLRPDLAATGGSALIGYILNAAGSFARTVQSWFRSAPPSLFDFIPPNLHDAIQAGTQNAVDLAPYINAAILHVTNLPRGGKLRVPAGVYRTTEIDGTLDYLDFNKHFEIEGDGKRASLFMPFADNVHVVLNLSGRQNIICRNFGILSDKAGVQCGLFLSRIQIGGVPGTGKCDSHAYKDIFIGGAFTKAPAVTVGAESMRWDNFYLTNSNEDAKWCTFWTSNRNSFVGVTPAKGGTLDDGPNTDNIMRDGIFYSAYPGSGQRAIKLSASAAFSFPGSLVIPGGATEAVGISYQDPIDDVWNGPVDCSGTMFEIFGANGVCHLLDCTAPTSYNGISCAVANYTLAPGAHIMDYNRDILTSQPILFNGAWSGIRLQNDPAGAGNFYVYAMVGCDINLRTAANASVVVVDSFIAESKVDANAVLTPQFISMLYQRAVTSMPNTGTYGKGARIENIAAIAGQPLDYNVTTGGTFGNAGTVTANTTAGSNLITIAGPDAVNISEGQKIAIAGAAGSPFYVRKRAGAQVWLSAIVGNSVAGAAVSYSPPVLVSGPLMV